MAQNHLLKAEQKPWSLARFATFVAPLQLQSDIKVSKN